MYVKYVSNILDMAKSRNQNHELMKDLRVYQ